MLFIERIKRPSKPSMYDASAARPYSRVLSSVLKKMAVGSVRCSPSTGASRIPVVPPPRGSATAELDVPKSIAQ